jgi:multidrug efflux pump subunit AcrA (membrane-fusion protein)
MTDRRSLLVAVALGVVVTGCGDRSRATAPPPPSIVKAELVVERDVPISAEWVGTLVGYISAQIRPRVSGHLISQNYTEGALVKTGDLLFQVDPRPYQVALSAVTASCRSCNINRCRPTRRAS